MDGNAVESLQKAMKALEGHKDLKGGSGAPSARLLQRPSLWRRDLPRKDAEGHPKIPRRRGNAGTTPVCRAEAPTQVEQQIPQSQPRS
ncbi:hypothetical protein CEXT_446201 [Caerostris extrusa]|uniref:Uncharacterized protein n=1 Tax=Caerostris extrusa TaxID=172846 RepID=A0AAV4PJC1_CAEEX|nr:hypothetical protein CEXT_446201 [Caerostris extrusa]